jgi:hypothetical protein
LFWWILFFRMFEVIIVKMPPKKTVLMFFYSRVEDVLPSLQETSLVFFSFEPVITRRNL